MRSSPAGPAREGRLNMKSRFIDLEMRMAFLERGLEKLDEVVIGQQTQIDQLLAENRRLKRALERALEGPEHGFGSD